MENENVLYDLKDIAIEELKKSDDAHGNQWKNCKFSNKQLKSSSAKMKKELSDIEQTELKFFQGEIKKKTDLYSKFLNNIFRKFFLSVYPSADSFKQKISTKHPKFSFDSEDKKFFVKLYNLSCNNTTMKAILNSKECSYGYFTKLYTMKACEDAVKADEDANSTDNTANGSSENTTKTDNDTNKKEYIVDKDELCSIMKFAIDGFIRWFSRINPKPERISDFTNHIYTATEFITIEWINGIKNALIENICHLDIEEAELTNGGTLVNEYTKYLQTISADIYDIIKKRNIEWEIKKFNMKKEYKQKYLALKDDMAYNEAIDFIMKRQESIKSQLKILNPYKNWSEDELEAEAFKRACFALRDSNKELYSYFLGVYNSNY